MVYFQTYSGLSEFSPGQRVIHGQVGRADSIHVVIGDTPGLEVRVGDGLAARHVRRRDFGHGRIVTVRVASIERVVAEVGGCGERRVGHHFVSIYYRIPWLHRRISVLVI